MKMYSLKCPHCDADLEIKDGLDIFFCQYCGGKIILSGLSKAAYRAKVRVMEMSHEEKLREKEIDQERYRMDFESREKHNEWIKKAIAVVATVVVCYFAIYYMPQHMFDSERKEHEAKIEYLQNLEEEIEVLFEKGEFDLALFKANQLYCDDNWSNEETSAWNAKRKSYIEMIEAKIHEEEINNPNNIFMPSDSKYFEGKNASDIEDQFKALGFTNIKLQSASEKAGFFNKAGTIEHILIGGKTKFTTEDYFDKDTSVIIYYYTE